MSTPEERQAEQDRLAGNFGYPVPQPAPQPTEDEK